MIRTLLENNVVPNASISQTAEELQKEYQKRQLKVADRYKKIIDDKLVLENSLSETDISSDDNDFSQEDAVKARHEFNSELDIARDEVQDFNNDLALLKKYGDDFAYLHRIKEIENLIDGKLKTSKHNLEKTIEVLTKLSPLQVLKNGYAFIEKDKKRVSSAESVNVGDELLITLYDGKIKAEVKEKEN